MRSSSLYLALFLFSYYMLFPVSVFGQSVDFSDPGKRLTPSPIVSTLGSFGGVDVKKSSGGIYKSIDLFNLNEGIINYSPSIEYFSTGVKVDDWGGRLGVDWNDNFTGVISRVVRSVPDEKATERSEATPEDFEEDTRANWEHLKRIHASNENGQGLDSEYDLFSYNIFGESGSFIIKQGQAILLNHQQDITIQVLTTLPYSFCLVKSNGVKYYFGINSEIELSGNDNDNICDESSPFIVSSPTAWFLSKIVSPNKDQLTFNYESAYYEYIYDYNETYTLRHGHDFEDEAGIPCDIDEFNNLYCIRKKWTSTKYLKSIAGSSFHVAFDYVSRNDLNGEKLISKVHVYNSQSLEITQVGFQYDEVVSSAPMESQLGVQNYDLTSVKTRYFLKKLTIGSTENVTEQEFSFSYINEGALPHRFSFSQDLAGYYNGAFNTGFIPNQVYEYINFTPQLRNYFTFNNLANRDPHPTLSQAGLLDKITYPTKGYDQIIYESNSYTAIEQEFDPATPYVQAHVNNDPSEQEEWMSQSLSVPFDQKVAINLHSGYGGVALPYDNDGSIYWIEFQLWDQSCNCPVPIPNTNDPIYKKTMKLFENYVGDVDLKKDVQYQLRFSLYGERSSVDYLIAYSSTKRDVTVEKPYVGQRVKEIRTNSGDSPELVKKYNYKTFAKSDFEIIYSVYTSANIADIPNPFDGKSDYAYKYLREVLNPCGIPDPEFPGDLPPGSVRVIGYHKLSSKSLFSIAPYQGSSISYACVTEFLDQSLTAFIASEYLIASDEEASWLRGDYWLSVPMSNAGWNGGLEKCRYFGTQKAGIFLIDKQQEWVYNTEATPLQYLYNYLVSQRYAPINVYSDAFMDRNLRPYTVVLYPLYSRWYKLDSFKESNHFFTPQGNYKVVSETKYKYNLQDRLLSEEESYNSVGDKLVRRMNRPKAMVASNLDPNGIYQAMVDNFITQPVIEDISFKNTNQLSLIRNNYYSPYVGLYVPQVIEAKTGSAPLEVRLRYLSYDNKGNVLCMSKEKDVPVSYIYGYNQALPIARIEGISYDQVKGVLGGEIVLQGENGQNLSSAQINTLRSNLPNALITTWTHKPLIGITSMTNSNNQTTHYEYQSGRLALVRNNSLQILQAFEYHYQTEN